MISCQTSTTTTFASQKMADTIRGNFVEFGSEDFCCAARVNLSAYFRKIFGAERQVVNILAQSFGAEKCSDRLWRSTLAQKQRA